LRKYFFPLLLLIAVIRVVYTKPDYKEGEEITIKETVRQEPSVGEGYQLIKVNGLKILLPRYPEISYGDNVMLTGVYQNGEVTNAKLISTNKGGIFLSNLRNQIIEFTKKTLPEPHSSLVAGVTLGSKSGIPYDFSLKIRKTGVAHVVVASGMNVSLVASVILGILLIFMRRRRAIVALYVSIFIYVCLSGFDPPIVRAAIMAGVVYLGQLFGRVVSTIRVLLITIMLMIIIFPYWLLDIGFILSAIATLSLILFEKSVRKRLSLVPAIFKESLSTTLAAQIGVTPILYVTFGSIYILSPIVNALVLWTIPLITILGMISAITFPIFPWVSKITLYLAYPLTSWFTVVVDMFAK
jgi:competence protein ComEC